jgi:hypothetical protein
MSQKKVKKLNESDYQDFIKELLGEESCELLEPQKKD